MKWPQSALEFNASASAQEITEFIQEKFNHLNRHKAIIGLSGGLDSSLTSLLAVKALGNDSIQLVYIPEQDSKPIHRQHAILISNQLNLELKIIKITPALKRLGIYKLLPLSLIRPLLNEVSLLYPFHS